MVRMDWHGRSLVMTTDDPDMVPFGVQCAQAEGETPAVLDTLGTFPTADHLRAEGVDTGNVFLSHPTTADEAARLTHALVTRGQMRAIIILIEA